MSDCVARSLTVALLAAWMAGCESSPDQAAARNEYLVRTLVSAEEAADSATLAELFWPDATYDDYANQLQYRGIQEIVGYLTSVHTWGDDLYIDIGEVHASAWGAVAEWNFSAVQSRPMGDYIPMATGKDVVVNGATIIEVDGGRIRRAADYLDTSQIWLQLGGRIELPGGHVIQLDEPGR
jgi:hypothetical protein